MLGSKEKTWVREEVEYRPWLCGFQPADLIDCNASGSSSRGQLADLINTNTAAEWPVNRRRAAIVPFQLRYAEINAGWESVYIVLTEEDASEGKEVIRITAEKIEHTRDVFGISVSHLAKILRTSRPTVYSWLEGEEPREQSMRRIQRIYEFADHWAAMNPYHFSPGPLLRQPLGKAPSLIERLEREDLNQDDIETGFSDLLQLMWRRRERMDRSKRRTEESSVSAADKDRNRRELAPSVGSSD